MWKILFPTEINVELPANFNKESMYPFIRRAIDEQSDAKGSKVYFDFSRLRFIDPTGVVVLSNLIEYFRRIGVNVWFRNHQSETTANRYLDDSGFFLRYLKNHVFANSSVRRTTIPLELVEHKKTVEFLHCRLMPWIGLQVGLQENSLVSLRSCVEEVFHNINHHSGVPIGCVFCQYFPKTNEIQLAISDFGSGIPES
jgi:ABC-type transporter Mla MlaB component